ncbi:hypothetical protein LINPERHAP2_LOCUS38311 [Linum perenne]
MPEIRTAGNDDEFEYLDLGRGSFKRELVEELIKEQGDALAAKEEEMALRKRTSLISTALIRKIIWVVLASIGNNFISIVGKGRAFLSVSFFDYPFRV